MFKNVTEKPTTEKLEAKTTDIPKLYIKYEALLKMNQIVNTCTAEVGWLGSVEEKDRVFYVTDVFLLKQKVTGVTTELDEEALSDLLLQMVNEDQEKYNTIKLWGHSHVKMEVNPSSQDDETFKEYYQDNPFFIRLIANQKEDMRIDIAIREDGLIYHRVPWEVVYPGDIVKAMKNYAMISEELKAAEDEIETLKGLYESSFSTQLNEEIKDKVIKETKYVSVKKAATEPAVPFSWSDDEMDDYAYHYGYGYDYGYDYENYIMRHCDTGKKIKHLNENKYTEFVNITDIYDAYEIIEIATNCKSWKQIRDYLAGDERIEGYYKRDYVDLYDGFKSLLEEYERRIA